MIDRRAVRRFGVRKRRWQMAATWERDGVRFMYPENWTLEDRLSAEGWSVTVQSPDTAFMMLNVYPEQLDVAELLETAMSALRDEYPGLECVKVSERIAQNTARGYDVQFFYLDLTNTCWLRCFTAGTRTVLIFCQASDLETDRVEPVFRAMRKSLELLK